MIKIIESQSDLLEIKKKEKEIFEILKINRKNIDINYLSEYLYLNSFKKRNTIIYFLYKKKNNFFLNIFLKKQINIEGFKNFFDIETPHGYGGPITNSLNRTFLQEADLLFENWCKSKNILCQLTRLNPLLENIKGIISISKKAKRLKKIALFDLSKNKTNILNYDTKTRNMIKRNLNNTVEFKKIDNQNFDHKQFILFKENYINSMIEKKAKKFYFFNEAYFDRMVLLIKSDKAFLINAFHNDKIIAGAIFLYSHYISYYHLSFQKKFPGIMNTIIYKSTLILQKKNKKFLVLGGGNLNSDDDNLLKFKIKMSNMVNYFYLESKIFNEKIYKQICNKIGIKKPKKLFFYRDHE